MIYLFWIIVTPVILGITTLTLLFIGIVYQLIKNESKKLSKYPEIAIIVPVYNEDPVYVIEALESIDQQNYPIPIHVVIADDGSTNNICKHIEKFLETPRKQNFIFKRFTQNHGSKGKVLDSSLHLLPSEVEAVVVVDSDTYILKNSVIQLVERMWQSEKCAAVCGYIVPANKGKGLVQKFQQSEYLGVFPIVKGAQDMFGMVSIMTGAFVIHRMSVIKRIGGFGSWVVEDIAWTWKALAHGYETGYVPTAVAYTYGPTNFKDLFKQRRRWARGRVEAQKASWNSKKGKRLLLLPMFTEYVVGLFLPIMLMAPFLFFLVITLEQWWVFFVIFLSMILSIFITMINQKRLPLENQKNFNGVIISHIYKAIFDIYVWTPNLYGFFDEILDKEKKWMSRN